MQWKLLENLLHQAESNSQFYKKVFSRENIDVKSITSFLDFRKLPLMDKYDILNNHPFEILSCKKENVNYVHSSGGTSGKSKLILYDREYWHSMIGVQESRAEMMGIKKHSVIAMMQPLGIAPSGHMYMKGLEESFFIIPFGSTIEHKFVLELIETLEAQSIWTSPQLAISLTKSMLEIKPKGKFNVSSFLTGGAPLTVTTRQFIKQHWNADAYDAFGATEVGSLGGECKEHNGIHIFPDMVYIEVLDQETGLPVLDGQMGELVVTPLQNKATPLFRYRLDDLVIMSTEPCKCGRISPRIWFKGRTGNTVFLGSHKVYDFQIEEVLQNIKGASTNYNLRVTKENNKDSLNYIVEVIDDKDIDNENLKLELKKNLENLSITHKQGITEGRFVVNINLVKHASLPKNDRGKLKDQVLDLREEA